MKNLHKYSKGKNNVADHHTTPILYNKFETITIVAGPTIIYETDRIETNKSFNFNVLAIIKPHKLHWKWNRFDRISWVENISYYIKALVRQHPFILAFIKVLIQESHLKHAELMLFHYIATSLCYKSSWVIFLQTMIC